MGTLIPIGQGADTEIKNKLNKVFRGANYTRLKNHQIDTGEDLLDSNHRLARLAHRLRAFPAGRTPRRKWFWLLNNLRRMTNGSMTDTEEAIKWAIRKAFADPAINRIVFEASEDPKAGEHYVHPSNDNPGDRYGSTMQIMLMCPEPLNPKNQDDPPDAVGPEPDVPNANDPERTTVRRGAKKSGKKSAKRPAKKSVRKAVKKSTKKPTKKPAKKGVKKRPTKKRK
jgi:hypothetical protein